MGFLSASITWVKRRRRRDRSAAGRLACVTTKRVGLARIVLWVGCILLAQFATDGHAQMSREYDLKAVFVYNLATFVEWPSSAFTADDGPLVIGVIGVDPFGGVLEQVVQGEYVGRHPLVVRQLRALDDVDECHLLFISSSEHRRLGRILARVRERPILTVGDLPGFVEAGGMVGFATEREQLHLYVNPAAVNAASLTVSSKLLEVARVVGGTAAAIP